MSWNPKRRISRTSLLGISNTQKDRCEIKDEFFQNNSFGKTYSYDNLESAVKKAKKLNLSKELIDRFIERYSNRENIMKTYKEGML